MQPLRLWFRATWCVAAQKNGASTLGMQRVAGPEGLRKGLDLASQAPAGRWQVGV